MGVVRPVVATVVTMGDATPTTMSFTVLTDNFLSSIAESAATSATMFADSDRVAVPGEEERVRRSVNIGPAGIPATIAEVATER